MHTDIRIQPQYWPGGEYPHCNLFSEWAGRMVAARRAADSNQRQSCTYSPLHARPHHTAAADTSIAMKGGQ